MRGHGSLQWEKISCRHAKRGKSTPHVAQQSVIRLITKDLREISSEDIHKVHLHIQKQIVCTPSFSQIPQRCIYIHIVCHTNSYNKSRRRKAQLIRTFHGKGKLHASLLLTFTVSSRSGWIGIHSCLAPAEVGAHQIDTLCKCRAVVLSVRSTFIPVCKTRTRTLVRQPPFWLR